MNCNQLTIAMNFDKISTIVLIQSPMSKKKLAPQIKPPVDVKELQKHGFQFFEEFKAFALKGNIIDLAVGIIVGTAFNNLVQSLVKDLIMPIFGWILAGKSFAKLYIVLGGGEYETLEAAQADEAPVLLYGLFINNLIDFLILALTVFIVLRYFLRIKKADDAAK